MDILPYTITVSSERSNLLHQRLSLTTFPDELDAAGWDYGAPLEDIKRLAEYWQNGFDWKAQESKLNRLPNFQANVNVKGHGDVNVHFLHQKSAVRNAIPLLFVHGWPGSFIEVTKILPLLTAPSTSNAPAFHVVAPSLPNFGFSARTPRRGFGIAQHAETCHNLMRGLGYERYVTQGGDWGFYITRAISLLYPASCLATHINMIRAEAPKFSSQPLLALTHAVTSYSDAENQGLERTAWFAKEGSGYRLEQATKPQTLAYSLTDSPVGWLAWLWEKLHDWTDDYPWTDDEILTWASIYWFSTSGGPGPSLRIYFEAVHQQTASDEKTVYVSRDRTTTWIESARIGVAHFPKELGVVPRKWVHTLGNVVYEREHDGGGHFAAWERPEALVNDVRGMFGKGGPCEGLVKGTSGYD